MSSPPPPSSPPSSSSPSAPSPPGPPWTATFSVLRGMFADALGLLDSLAAEHGGLLRIPVAGEWVWLISEPDYVEHILKDNAKNYVKSSMYEDMRPLLGNGLLTSEGELWKRQRRLAQPAFHHRHLETFSRITAEEVERTLAGWAPGQTLDMAHAMMELAFRIATRTLFGADLAADLEAAHHHFGVVARAIVVRSRELLKLPIGWPTPNNRRYTSAVKALDALVFKLIAARRAEPAAAASRRDADLLGLLLAAKDEDTGEGMDDKQLRDEVLTFLLAGHETTATSLAWELYLLAQHPAEQARARAEAQALPGPPSFADLKQLAYVRRVVDEGLRLYPPVWWFERSALNPDQLGPYAVPAGTRLALSPWLSHRKADRWEAPLRFDPDRFLPERAAGRHRFAYYPFAGGPRVCIGNTFSLVTSTQALGAILQRFGVEPVPERPIELEPLVTVRSKTGVHLRLTA